MGKSHNALGQTNPASPSLFAGILVLAVCVTGCRPRAAHCERSLRGDDVANQPPKRWTIERAADWQREHPWLVGCNYIPSTAINQLDMWQADTFDLETIDRELGWAEELGLEDAVSLLEETLEEEKATDEALTKIAETAINQQAEAA